MKPFVLWKETKPRASFTPTVTIMLRSASAAIRIASPKAMVWLKR